MFLRTRSLTTKVLSVVSWNHWRDFGQSSYDALLMIVRRLLSYDEVRAFLLDVPVGRRAR